MATVAVAEAEKRVAAARAALAADPPAAAEEQQVALKQQRAALQDALRQEEAALVAAQERMADAKQLGRANARAAAMRKGNALHVEMFDVAEALGGKFSNLRSGGDNETGRFEARDMVFGLSKHAAAGVERYLCIGANGVRSGMNRGAQGIVAEVEAHGSEVDIECLNYVLHEEAGSNAKRFQGGLMRDCDVDGKLHPSRRTGEGRGMRLADFLADPAASKADLEEASAARLEPSTCRSAPPQSVGLTFQPLRGQAHVLALRLCTTAAYRTINSELRNQARFDRGEAHPLPLTVAWIRNALEKLRTIEAESERATEVVYLYRGMAGVRIQPEFLKQGGTELAPMSTTSSLKVAMQYS